MKALTVIIYITMVAVIYGPMEIMAMDLAQFQWKNRLLFLVAPDSSNPLFKSLHSELHAQQAEVKDRDLVVFEVLEREASKMNTTPIDPQAADSIRDRFSVSPNIFSLILVGKDGGIKLKRYDQVSLEEIFDLIDSMPMRQREMQQKNN